MRDPYLEVIEHFARRPPGISDLLGSGRETDTYLYLKYYADQDWRQRWLADFPDYDMPAHEDPPYERDRHLPQSDDEPPPEAEPERMM